MPLPTVAIVGRPNVGKSTLFNRLVGRRVALVDDRPGVTRDRREGEGHLFDLSFRVMDTAGFEDQDPQSLPGRMRAQTDAAVREADVALFLIDAREGLTPLDEEIARWLRSHSTPVVIAANKAESRAGESGILEAYSLGLGEPIAISAEPEAPASVITCPSCGSSRRRCARRVAEVVTLSSSAASSARR